MMGMALCDPMRRDTPRRDNTHTMRLGGARRDTLESRSLSQRVARPTQGSNHVNENAATKALANEHT